MFLLLRTVITCPTKKEISWIQLCKHCVTSTTTLLNYGYQKSMYNFFQLFISFFSSISSFHKHKYLYSPLSGLSVPVLVHLVIHLSCCIPYSLLHVSFYFLCSLVNLQVCVCVWGGGGDWRDAG